MKKTWLQSPIGWLEVIEQNGRLWSVDVVDSPGGEPDSSSLLEEATKQLQEWFARERTDFDLPLAERGTPFQRRVWGELRKVRWGETVAYGELAARLGDSKLARAVGAAMAANPWLLVVPCHRVKPKSGGVGNYRAGAERKRWLLAHEAKEM